MTWVSLSWQVLCVNPCRGDCSGLFPTMDMHFPTWGSANARLHPSVVVMGWHSSHTLFALKSISSTQNHVLECLLKSFGFVFFFWRNSVYRWTWCCISMAEKVRSKKVAFLWNKRSVNALFCEEFISTGLDQLLEATPTAALSEHCPSCKKRIPTDCRVSFCVYR